MQIGERGIYPKEHHTVMRLMPEQVVSLCGTIQPPQFNKEFVVIAEGYYKLVAVYWHDSQTYLIEIPKQ